MTRYLVSSLFLVSCALGAAGCECGSSSPVDGSVPPSDGGVLPDGRVLDDGGGTPNTGPTITVCPGDSLPALSEGVCEATAGDDNLLITGDILTPGEVFRGGQVLVGSSGRIECVGCDCSSETGAASATTVVCPDGVVSPGLINGHEHLRFVAGPPTMTAERYEHRQDWREGLGDHTEIRSGGTSSTDMILWEELRMTMAGVTAGNTNGGRDGFVRNLDEGNTEGLGAPRINYQTFILGEADGDPPMSMGCGYDRLPSAADIADDAAFTPHLAEGIADTARNEFLCVREGATDIIQPNTALIHGVGLLAPDVAEIANDGTTLIWSPRTNISLYGDTARVTLYDNLGVLIALGTDWMRSGSMNMLRELQCADELNRDYFGEHFTDEDLWLMATRNAAVVLAYSDALGSLSVGLQGDIAIFDGSSRADHRAVIGAQPEDVALVVRGGTVLYGEASVVNVLESGCDAVDVCGEARAACTTREIGRSYTDLAAANSSTYPLFFCDQTPTDEPTCVPSRNAEAPLASPEVDGSNRYDGALTATDGDGDGIADAEDLCPTIFNPVRPVDQGFQADFDDDGLGDACDPCPLDADTTTCTAVDPDDRDRDSVPDGMDNCPNAPNPDQDDTDEDGIGDACDACPDAPNPGGSACPATIYEVKTDLVTVGAAVAISQSVVVAVGTNGFTMQVPTDHPDYVGPEFSGIYVYTASAPTVGGGTALAVGDTVDVSAEVNSFFGQTQLSNATVMLSATSSAVPAAVVALPSDLDTGGSRADALEAVLVRVESIAVTDAAPAPTRTGATADGEFEVDATLRVDDAFFLIDPFVASGENFESITGVMQFRDERHKLCPRSADDYVAGAPSLASITPELSFLRDGSSEAPTFPEPLTVSLTRAPAMATTVSLSSSDMGVLTVMDVTVSPGSLSVTVPVTGASPGTATITASLGGSMQTATVRVLGGAEAPTSLELSPATSRVRSEGTQTFTVTLDIPAPSGGSRVTLSDTSGGSLPAEITVAADSLSASFEYSAPVGPATGTVTATLVDGGAMASASLEIDSPAPGTLIINEVDYDQVDTDVAEYVELYNPGTTAVSLAGKQLVLVNQTGSQYRTIDLSTAGSELAPGGFLVARAAGLPVAGGALTVDLPAASDNIQNGPDDGMFVIDSGTGTILDIFGYEGSTSTDVGGVTVTIEGGTLEDSNRMNGSLSRVPDGLDTDSTDDWTFTSCLTPGAANVDSSTASCP